MLIELLRPAVRFALSRGFKVQELTEALKRCLVEEASKELIKSGDSLNKSRVSVMTGLQRRDVTRLNDLTDKDVIVTVNVLTKVIGKWEAISSTLSLKEEFPKLVYGVSRDLNPQSVLSELDRLALIEQDSDSVTLLSKSFSASGDAAEGYAMLARDIDTLNDAVSENIKREHPIPNLHINTHYDDIIVAEHPMIREWLLQKGAEFHRNIRNFLSKYDKDMNPTLYKKPGGLKVSVCSFSKVEEIGEHAEEEVA